MHEYTIRPDRSQFRRMSAAADELREMGSEITVNELYEFAAARVLDLYDRDFERLINDLGEYLHDR